MTIDFFGDFNSFVNVFCKISIDIEINNFRSSGDTLSRENFYKLKQRLAETRMLAAGLARPEDTYTSQDDNGFGVIDYQSLSILFCKHVIILFFALTIIYHFYL